MLGIVHHAKVEFEKLSEVADVTVCQCARPLSLFTNNLLILTILENPQQVTSGSRDEFIRDCDSGKYNNVVAISRTYDSVAVRLTRQQSDQPSY